MYPYFPGSQKTYSPYPEERNQATYENSQRQRLLERKIREGKRNVMLMEKTKDEVQIGKAKEILRNREYAMKTFISDTGRKRRMDREEVY